MGDCSHKTTNFVYKVIFKKEPVECDKGRSDLDV